MIVKREPTCVYKIWMAGDILAAKKSCREYCDNVGFCVTVTPTTYVYTGGEEDGIIVGILQYPRFPIDEKQLRVHAGELAEKLKIDLKQDSYLIEGPKETVWKTNRE